MVGRDSGGKNRGERERGCGGRLKDSSHAFGVTGLLLGQHFLAQLFFGARLLLQHFGGASGPGSGEFAAEQALNAHNQVQLTQKRPTH